MHTSDSIRRHPARRPGFTLIEMVVVITIILVIAAIGVSLLPRFLDNQMQTRAVDQISQWLLTAKQRAKRDDRPTGLRILVDPSTGLATQLFFVQQPDPYTPPRVWNPATNSYDVAACLASTTFTQGTLHFSESNFTNSGTATVDFQGAAQFAGFADETYGDLGTILAGDYVEFNGGASVYYISTVKDAHTLILGNSTFQLATQTTDWRILRQPRRLLGEDVLTLPQDMVIDANSGMSVNIPTRIVPGTNINGQLTVYEIVFSPEGGIVMGRGTASGKILMWVRNVNKSGDLGAATLISIQIRTGFIAAHPVSFGSDPYQFAEDGRSSGL